MTDPCLQHLTDHTKATPDELLDAARSALLDKLTSYSWYSELSGDRGGKMFGVAIVERERGYSYLAAFSGMLNRQWHLPPFVPPVFNTEHYQSVAERGAQALESVTDQIERIRMEPEHVKLQERVVWLQHCGERAITRYKCLLSVRKKRRHELRALIRTVSNPVEPTPSKSTLSVTQLNRQSQLDRLRFKRFQQTFRQRLALLQLRLDYHARQIAQLESRRGSLSKQIQSEMFDCYQLMNHNGQSVALTSCYESQLPPGGAGDCCMPKLLHYANQRGLNILTFTEFWVGTSGGTHVRHHGKEYTCCRARCQPLLSVLAGPALRNAYQQGRHQTLPAVQPATEIRILQQDEDLLVIDKPAGLLSTPGKSLKDSVQTRLQLHFPDDRILCVHRLDMDTSGVLVVARNLQTYRALQAQFLHRQVHKRYVAVVNCGFDGDKSRRCLIPANRPVQVNLPLRVDLLDRPRQQVCHDHGKRAITRFRVLEQIETGTRLACFPVTGRTHQIRVHAAHRDGLGSAIRGDRLYAGSLDSAASGDARLYLHAERILFTHPTTGQRQVVRSPCPF